MASLTISAAMGAEGPTPALELAATLVPGSHRDPLEGPAGLATWLEEHRGVFGEPGSDTALRVAEFRGLRRSVAGILASMVAHEPLPAEAVRGVNDASAAAPTWSRLDVTDPDRPVARISAGARSRTGEILAVIARSAIEIVGGPERERLRRCEAPRCGRYFLARRRGTLWCSPGCGNRARVARHLARRRGQGPASDGTS